MSLISFEELPEDARLWCFGATRPPEGRETARLLDSMRRFLVDWTAHDETLRAALDWRHQRFLLVGVDEAETAASGCSIDALLRRLKELEGEIGLRLTDRAPVWYRARGDQPGIRCVSRAEFRDLARRSEVDGRTPVFDLTIDTVAQARGGALEVPAERSWHRSLLAGEERPSAASG